MNTQEPMQESVQTQEVVSHENPVPTKPSKCAKIVASLALLIALAAASGVAYLWQQAQINLKQSKAQMAQLQKDLYQANDLLNQQNHTLKALQETNQQKQGDAALLEASYLTQLAAIHLTYEKNIPLAQQLLESANQRISDGQNAALLAKRQALAEDIALLHAAPVVDVPELTVRLNALIQEAERLPQMPIRAAVEKEPVAQEAANQSAKTIFSNKFKEFLASVGHSLSSMVIVSHDSKSIPSLLTAEQRLYIITNIQSQLLLTEWAVIHREEKTYQQGLNQVENWINQYFSADSPQVQNMLQTVAELKKIVVNPQVPTIERSLEALKQ